jgi:hypothetical protein
LRQIFQRVLLFDRLARPVPKSVSGPTAHQLDQGFESVVDVF